METTINRELAVKLVNELRCRTRPATSIQLHDTVNPTLETKVDRDETLRTLEWLLDAGSIARSESGRKWVAAS